MKHKYAFISVGANGQELISLMDRAWFFLRKLMIFTFSPISGIVSSIRDSLDMGLRSRRVRCLSAASTISRVKGMGTTTGVKVCICVRFRYDSYSWAEKTACRPVYPITPVGQYNIP